MPHDAPTDDRPDRLPAEVAPAGASSIDAKLDALARRALGEVNSPSTSVRVGVDGHNLPDGVPSVHPGQDMAWVRPSEPAARVRIEAKLDALERRALGGVPMSGSAPATDPPPRPAADHRPVAGSDEEPKGDFATAAGHAADHDSAPDTATESVARLPGSEWDGAWTPPDARRPADRLESRLAEIYDASLPTPAGRAFYGPDDHKMRNAALNVHPDPKMYTADLHGRPDSFVVAGAELSSGDLSALIEADEGWRGEAIRLVSCRTGRGDRPVAQELANHLGVPGTGSPARVSGPGSNRPHLPQPGRGHP